MTGSQQSSQESLPLSQETFNCLWNMMDETGRTEMFNNCNPTNWGPPESVLVPSQPSEVNSPLVSQLHARSSLLGRCSWTGNYGFKILFESQEKINKHISWTYSEADNKLYVKKDSHCPFSFQTDVEMPDEVFLRAMAVFTSPEHANDVVHRCVNHSQQEIVQGIFEAEHLVRSVSPLAHYEVDADSKRHSVIVPFEKPPVGQAFSTYIFKFACFGSCAGGPNRRPITLIFTLEHMNNVLGRVVLDLKICACPGRDKLLAEKDHSVQVEKLSQPTSSKATTSTKVKRDSSYMSIPQDYFEHFPKKKKPEKEEEYIIKVKDKECYNFLLQMKGLFQGSRRFTRIPAELKDFLRICRSSSDEDEKSSPLCSPV